MARKSGHKEDRLYCIEMYTDDPMGGIVGVRRMVSFLICWTRTTKVMRLKMAIATKRQLGCSVKWIGARYYSLGMVVVPKDKRRKVLQSLLLLIQGKLDCGELRSLNGLLEFIMVVRVLKRNRMAGMYEPFQSGREAEKGPETIPRVTNLMRQTSWAWSTEMASGCAVPFSEALRIIDVKDSQGRLWGPSVKVPAHCTYFSMTSDSSLQGAKVPGMGGVFCSMWWTFPLGASLSKLDIPALELIAVGINFIMFGDVIAQLLRVPSNVVVAFIDTQASPQLLI